MILGSKGDQGIQGLPGGDGVSGEPGIQGPPGLPVSFLRRESKNFQQSLNIYLTLYHLGTFGTERRKRRLW